MHAWLPVVCLAACAAAGAAAGGGAAAPPSPLFGAPQRPAAAPERVVVDVPFSTSDGRVAALRRRSGEGANVQQFAAEHGLEEFEPYIETQLMRALHAQNATAARTVAVAVGRGDPGRTMARVRAAQASGAHEVVVVAPRPLGGPLGDAVLIEAAEFVGVAGAVNEALRHVATDAADAIVAVIHGGSLPDEPVFVEYERAELALNRSDLVLRVGDMVVARRSLWPAGGLDPTPLFASPLDAVRGGITLTPPLRHRKIAAYEPEQDPPPPPPPPHPDSRVAAMLCVHDEAAFLPTVIEAVLAAHVELVLVLVSTQPWRGPAKPIDDTLAALAPLLATGRVSVLPGAWPSEAAQRSFAQRTLRAHPGNFSHVLVVDSDEVWDPHALARALRVAAERPDLGALRAPMVTYWKTARTRVWPAEPLQLLFLAPVDCDFDPRAPREPLCARPTGFLSADLAECHHLSYARTTRQLERGKLASFEHAHEVVPGWLERVWRGWDADPAMRGLHPVEPAAYGSAVRMPVREMAAPLRGLLVSRCSHGLLDEVLCGALPLAVADEDDEEVEAAETEPVLPPPLRPLEPLHVYGAWAPPDASDILGNAVRPQAAQVDAIPPAPLLVVVVGEGAGDTSTGGVFLEVAHAVAAAEGGEPRFCRDLRFCAFPSDPDTRFVVLGAHNLGRYFDGGGRPAALADGSWPPPARTVLYNFEAVVPGNPLLTEATLAVYRRFRVWDYSERNVEALAALGVRAELRPLPALPATVPASVPPGDIPVLFFGMVNAHRARTLARIRAAGVPVYAVSDVYGAELDRLVARARVVLSLRYFEADGEWKWTRIAKAVANGRPVVAEAAGAPEEAAPGSGVVVAGSEGLVVAILSVLED